MRLVTSIFPLEEGGKTGDALVQIESAFELDDANQAAEDLGLSIMEAILAQLRANRFADSEDEMVDAFDLTIEVVDS